jgi:hypothetical protein
MFYIKKLSCRDPGFQPEADTNSYIMSRRPQSWKSWRSRSRKAADMPGNVSTI